MATATFSPEAPAAPTAEGRLEELRLWLDPGVRYRLETLFPKVSGLGWKGAIRKKHDLVRRIEPVLRKALGSHEEVLYVAKGVQQSVVEHYFLGVWAHTINQTVFVLTNARMLLLRTDSKGTPKQTFWSIYYSQIDVFRPSWTGGLKLRLRDGRKLKFMGFGRADRASMPRLIQGSLENFRRLGFDPAVTQSMENLCSHCLGRVPKDLHECGRCGSTFWTPMGVALRSLLFPSWGDVCLKHYTLAVTEFVGFVVAWAMAVGSILSGRKDGRLIEGILFAVFVLAFTHGADAVLTYVLARKGLHPRRGPASYTSDAGTTSRAAVSPA